MILTKELLQSANACTEGFKFGLDNNLINGDYDSAVQFCNDNGQPEFGGWLTDVKNTIEVWRTAGLTFTEHQYRFFNFGTNTFQIFESKDEAITILNSAREDFKLLNKAFFSVVIENVNENGDAVWSFIDIDNYDKDENFQVFNQLTGLHTKIFGKNNAVQLRDQFLNDYCAQQNWILEVNYINDQGDITSNWEAMA